VFRRLLAHPAAVGGVPASTNVGDPYGPPPSPRGRLPQGRWAIERVTSSARSSCSSAAKASEPGRCNRFSGRGVATSRLTPAPPSPTPPPLHHRNQRRTARPRPATPTARFGRSSGSGRRSRRPPAAGRPPRSPSPPTASALLAAGRAVAAAPAHVARPSQPSSSPAPSGMIYDTNGGPPCSHQLWRAADAPPRSFNTQAAVGHQLVAAADGLCPSDSSPGAPFKQIGPRADSRAAGRLVVSSGVGGTDRRLTAPFERAAWFRRLRPPRPASAPSNSRSPSTGHCPRLPVRCHGFF